MARFRFVHAADLHLDTPFEGLATASPDVAAALRDASLEAFDALVDLTIERDAAFLVLAGDVYDGAQRGVRAQLRFRSGLERLAERGVGSFVVHGNHDPVAEGWSAIREWPPGVVVFGSDDVACAAVERDGQTIATVHGLSFERRDTSENLSLRFERGSAPGYQLGLLHCNVDSSGAHANYAPCTRADLEAAGMDYWALGHIHLHQVLARDASWIVYPGNLQGRSLKPSERGAKGAVVVEVEDERTTAVEHVALDRVRFEEVALDVSECTDLVDLERLLIGAADEVRSAIGERGLVLRARLTGRAEIRDVLRRPGVLPDLLTTLRDGLQGARPFVWWDSIEDETRSEIDRATLRAGSDFRAALLAESDALAADDSFFRDLAGGIPPRLRGVALPEAAESELEALRLDGEALALDALENEAEA